MSYRIILYYIIGPLPLDEAEQGLVPGRLGDAAARGGAAAPPAHRGSVGYNVVSHD